MNLYRNNPKETTIITLFLLLILFKSILSTHAIKTRLTWVNGIAHSIEHMEEGGKSISDYFGGKKVEFCHNPTSMTSEDDYVGFIGDLTQAGSHKLGRITSEVDALVRHLRQTLKQVGPSGIIVHIAHSQGALITSLAAKQLSSEEMTQIELICIGGATAMCRKDYPYFKRIVNYYSVNDPLLFIVPSAVQALRSGFFLSGQEPEFVFLSPRGGDPVIDHMLLGPTYSEALAWEGKRYQMVYMTLVGRIRRTLAVQGLFLYDELEGIVKLILEFFMKIYQVADSKWKEIISYCKEKIILPLMAILLYMIEYLKESIRIWRGQEKFEPVQHFLK